MSNASGIFTQSPHDEARAYFATAIQMHSDVARLNTSTSKNPSLDVTGEISATIPAHGTKDRFGMPRLELKWATGRRHQRAIDPPRSFNA